MLKILSLGAGVQSTTLLLMSCKGELPKLDCAIFADTGWEPKAVYEHFDWLKAESEKYGIPVHVVSEGNLRDHEVHSEMRNGKSPVMIPYRTKKDGKIGMIRRQCTNHYKIKPINKFIRRSLLGLEKGQRYKGEPVTVWKGISSDESRRATISKDWWYDFEYPLIDPSNMTRFHCIKWFEKHYNRPLPRSACIGCPYKGPKEWAELKKNYPEEWQDAIEFDRAMRKKGGEKGDFFLTRECIPLEELDLMSPEDHGQLGFSEECMGMCGV